ncbi:MULTISPECIES: FeoB-associated Cys-rich membrane protein [Caproicibacterium]|uniref:FeoB-associated Cys-rich membrane protein n=1 Tax=Caproicibacterium argilliputei TaxID=3030016 RepID=A0AA97H379_9FIRM|nr:FeoB-associated Cys-rich membrane protein [Caproicibacterium argilliputei]WOC32927.1 FeoB-associated Cys-rich membrane protein [Caproicibacterium argilliputei]
MLATVLITLVLVALMAAVIAREIYNRKHGKGGCSGCSGGCSSCSGNCHPK